jgi:hypothetical protein
VRRGRGAVADTTLAEEIPLWRATGRQDWGNAGSPLEDAQSAKIAPVDDRETARRKLLKMLLRDTTVDSWGGSGIEGP